MKTALVILNGDKFSRSLLLEFWQKADLKVCADGAAEILRNYQLKPDVILGDLDSISEQTCGYFDSIPILQLSDQNTTDSEKAFQYCIDKSFKHINVVGAFGGRIDHELYNIELLKKVGGTGINIILHTENEKLFLIGKKTEIHEQPGTRISLMPIFGEVRKVELKGVKYPLHDQKLEFGHFSSISNEFLSDTVVIDFSSGELLVIIEKSGR